MPSHLPPPRHPRRSREPLAAQIAGLAPECAEAHTGAIPWRALTLDRMLAAEDALLAAYPSFRTPSVQTVNPAHSDGRGLQLGVPDRHMQAVIQILESLHTGEPLRTCVAHLLRYDKIKRFLLAHWDRLRQEALMTVGAMSMDLLEELAAQPYSVEAGTPQSTVNPEQIIAFAKARRFHSATTH